MRLKQYLKLTQQNKFNYTNRYISYLQSSKTPKICYKAVVSNRDVSPPKILANPGRKKVGTSSTVQFVALFAALQFLKCFESLRQKLRIRWSLKKRHKIEKAKSVCLGLVPRQ